MKFISAFLLQGVLGSCKDKNKYCSGFSSQCSDSKVQVLCPETCGVCRASQTDTEIPCEGKDTVALKCEQKCTIENGRPKCGCYPGFRLTNSNICEDINECAVANKCTVYGMKCVNYVGSFYCDSGEMCPAGEAKYYRKNGCCKFDDNENCGRPFQYFGRIWNGDDATRKQWSWMVHIQYQTNGGDTKLCSGTLIHKNWVLTAAHCVESVKDKYQTCSNCLKLYMGLYDYALKFSMEPERIPLYPTEIIIYESFDITVLKDDLALIKVETVDINQSEYVKPICLPGGEEPPEGTKCFIAGWGGTEDTDTRPTNLLETSVIISDLNECQDAYEILPTQSKVRKTDHICAMGQSYLTPEEILKGKNPVVSDACHGDSGGPLMCQRCENCNWFQAGVVSFGHKCGQTHGVYTSVAKYENWIREVIKEQRVSPKNQKGLPCKSCCQFLKISGSDIQTSRQGFYEIQSQIEGKRKVYKQMHKNEEINFLWFLGGHFNIWFVNDEIGKADDGGIMARSQAACPNFSSAWMIFDDIAKKWVKADGDFKVECVDDPTPRWSDWSEWEPCSQKCRKNKNSDTGSTTRSRTCSSGSDWKTCEGGNLEEKDCGSEICKWSSWSGWTGEKSCDLCGSEASKNGKTRTRSCPVKNGCEGKSEEKELCSVKTCPETVCCTSYKIENSGNDQFDGIYYLFKNLFNNAIAYIKEDQSNRIYYVTSFKLWVMNAEFSNSAVKAYTQDGKGDLSKICPDDLTKWQEMSSKTKVWTPMNSDMTIKCIEKPKAVWSEWTECDCQTKISKRSRDDETEEKPCPKCEIDENINPAIQFRDNFCHPQIISLSNMSRL